MTDSKIDDLIATGFIVDAPLLAVVLALWFTSPPAWYVLLVGIACAWLVGYVYRYVRDHCGEDDDTDEHAKFGGQRD